MMKKKLLLILFFFISISANSQLFQKNFEYSQGHFTNANLEKVNDGTDDVIVSSNLLSAASPIPVLKRLEDDGTLVWSKSYEDTSLANARFFDIANYFDLIFVTGSIDVNGTKKVFTAKIEAQTGDILEDKYYDVINQSFNSTGFNVIISESDATGNSSADPGLLVTGYFSSCFSLDPSCATNIGFALRTDLNLNTLWATEVDSPVSGNLDYDFLNGAVETSDGFVLTGSSTGELNTNVQAGVLVHKVDFEGNFVWNNSYIFGNARDLSVDAYYDSASDDVFILANYSNLHHFGVTAVDNSNGMIDPTKSWHVNEVNFNLDYYGFSLVESLSSPNNLTVYGYRRDYFDGTNTSQSNIIIYEFDKATGNEVGNSFQYITPFQETQTDDYNLWNGQLPLIFYPDMAILDSNAANPIHYTVGYREGFITVGGLANIEFINVDALKRNECNNIIVDYTRNALGNVDFIPNVTSAQVPITDNLMAFTDTTIVLDFDSCSDPLSTIDLNQINIKLYPNPASNYVFLNSEDIHEIQIMDIRGKKVYESRSHVNNDKIYVGNLKTGLYFVKIKINNNTSKTIKFIKE
jgi:hypothetical protein